MSNIFEKTCNEINDKLIVANSMGNAIIPQLGGGSDNVMQQIVNNSSNTYLNKAKDIIGTSYIIFGYEISISTLVIIAICLVAIAFLIYKYFFKSTSNIVNIKKFELTTDTDNETEESTENGDDENNEEEE